MAGNKSRFGAIACLACSLSVVLAPVAGAENARLGYVTADKVNVRASASEDAEVIGVQESKGHVLVIGGKGSFYEISFDGKSGYVSDSFSCVFDHMPGTVNADKVILRSEANTDSRKLDTIKKGDLVNIYDEENGFYKVTYEDRIGYVSRDYVDNEKKTLDLPEEVSDGSLEITADQPEERPVIERTVTPGEYTEDELYLIAQLIYAEGKGGSSESYEALASVVYNRLQSSKFPSTVEGVCYQSGQFTVVRKDSFRSSVPAQKALDAVQRVFVDGKVILPEKIMYFKSSRLSKEWGSSRDYYATIGGNMFYS